MIKNRWSDVFGSFNYLGFNIELKCSEDVFNDPSSSALTTLTHEYIHYLQAVKTPYGIHRTLVLIRSMLNVIDCIHIHSNPVPPLKSSINGDVATATQKYLNDYKNTALGTECLPLKKVLEEHRLFSKDYPDTLNGINRTIYHIPNYNYTTWVPLSQVSLEETMAIIAMFIFEGKRDHEIYNILTTPGIGEEYRAIYMYFYRKFPNIDNHAEFVFKFCNLCLMWRNPHESAPHIFRSTIKALLNITNFDSSSFFQELASQEYEKSIKDEQDSVQSLLDQTMDWCEKNNGTNHYIDCVSDLLGVLKIGLELNKSTEGLWHNSFDSEWRKQSIHEFGCPVIHLDDVEPFEYTTRNPNLSNAIDYIFGTDSILKNLVYEAPKECPFYLGICGAGVKKVITCLYNPLQIQEDTDGSSCIFRNTIHLIGISNILGEATTTTPPQFFGTALKAAKTLEPQLNQPLISEVRDYLNTIRSNGYLDSDTLALNMGISIVELSALAWSICQDIIRSKRQPEAWQLINGRLKQHLGKTVFNKPEYQLIIREVINQTFAKANSN